MLRDRCRRLRRPRPARLHRRSARRQAGVRRPRRRRDRSLPRRARGPVHVPPRIAVAPLARRFSCAPSAPSRTITAAPRPRASSSASAPPAPGSPARRRSATSSARSARPGPSSATPTSTTTPRWRWPRAGARRFWVSPAGGVETIGIAAQMLYANSLLEKLHVGVDFLQVGKYKGAQEPFTRDGPSPEARESLESALRGMRAGWLADIAEGRGKLSAAGAVEDGPFAPQEAKARGLVDEVGYADDAREDVKKLTGAERLVSRFGGGEGQRGGGGSLAGVLRALAGSGHVGTPHVAVVPASGSIAMSSSGSILGGNDGITERDLGKLITRLTNDSATKAVVLRIDSPGGSALASDLLWKKLMKLREKKTLVVSVGDMAASGGYYLSCAGAKIVAEPTSLLGSIGVVGGKLALGRALEQFGVHAETIAAAPDPTRAARASYLSSMTPWDDDTRARVLATMTSVYDLFLQRVAEGRGTTVDKIAPNAEGRVYGGVEAKERGMVDAIGGLSDAVDLAIELAGLPKDAPIDVVDDEPGLFELLDEGAVPGAGEASAAVATTAKRAAEVSALPPLLNEILPAARPFLGAFSPFLAGERVVAAMPYGITVR
ncbi:MAG: S49 family peptidase [Minicystis sp.]